MTDDLERHVRDRLQSASLPAAPDQLLGRVESVVAGPIQPRRGSQLVARPFLVTVAAGLLIVALAGVSMSAGWLSRPDHTSTPSAVALDGASLAPTSAPTPRIDCGPPIEADPAITCEQAIELARSGLEADLPPIVGVSVQRLCIGIIPNPAPPCTRTSLLRVTFTFAGIAPRTVQVFDTAPGETPRIAGPRGGVLCEPDEAWPGSITCAEAITQAAATLDPDHPAIRRTVVRRFCPASEGCEAPVSAVVEFEFDTATPQVVRVWIPGTAAAWPSGRGGRGPVSCPVEDGWPSVVSLPLDCQTAVDAVLRALEDDHPPVDSVSFRHGCPPEFGQPIDCNFQIYGYVEVRYATSPSITVQYFVRGGRDPVGVEPVRP